MAEIVNSLFGSYLQKDPMGVVDPRAPLLTGGGMMQQPAPTYQPQTQPAPTIQQQPLIKQAVEPIGKQPLTEYTSTPVMSEPPTTTTTYDPTAIDLSLLQDLDLSNLNLEGLADLSQYTSTELGDFTGLGTAMPTNPADYYTRSLDFLNSVASGNTADKVNRRDDIYNNFFTQQNQYTYEGDPADFRAEVGLSDTFAVYDAPESMINQQTVQDAFNILTTAENPLAALSDYYGFEITPTTNEGANYTNATKYGTTPESMAEFQSIIEPILQRSIPYIAATQGLNYTDALEYAYTHDPMIAALYNQYGVDLYRQTDDGSTYIYDPIAGQEIRTLEVKDASILPAVVGLGLTFAGVPGALGTALGASGTAATTLGSALMSGASTLIQGGDLEDALKAGITSAVTSGITGDLNKAVAATLGVSDDVAAGITAAGLSAAQGGSTEEALLSGFLAGASSYIQGELPSGAEWDADKNALVGPDGQVIGQQPDFVVGGPDAAASSAAAWSTALAGTENFAANQGGTTTDTPEIFAGRTTGEPTVDTTTGTDGGMLTADTPAGGIEEVVVSGDGGVQYTMPSNDGVIYQTAQDLTATPYGEYWFKTIQQVDPVGYEEMLSAFEGGAETFTWKGLTFNYADMMGTGATTTQLPDRVPPETGDTTVPAEPVTLEDTTAPDQPPLPPTDETLDIPEIPVENIPPEITTDVTPPVIPPVTPEPPVIPTPTGGGGGQAPATPTPVPTGTGAPTPPTIPTSGTEGTQGTTGTVTQGGGEEVVDVFGDAGLEGDAFGDSTVGGAEGGGAPVGGDAGTVDVTTTPEYQDLQDELNNALANQNTLEIEVGNLQNEVDAANAALSEAEAAADAAEAAGAANAEELRGEVAAAQATADSLQGELNNANEALGNANSEIESLQGQLSGTQEELGTALSTIETLTGELNAAQDAAAAAQAAADAAEAAGAANAAELRAEADAANETVNDLRGQLTEANTTITDLSGQLTTATEQNTALQGQLAEANANATDLESRLSTANTELNDLQTEYEKAVETNAANVADLEGEITDKQGEINDLESELSGATATIDDLEQELSDVQSELASQEEATAAAIAEGIANAEAAGEAGYGTGYGEGVGAGRGQGFGLGVGAGMLTGGGGGVAMTAPQTQQFMQELQPDLTKIQLQPYQPAKNYLDELIARLNA
jgi:predicted  nucleic acid-binding Zn-ribbon protein